MEFKEGSPNNIKHKYYFISERFLDNLLEKAFKYLALEAGGVDNWEHYAESFSDYLSENSSATFEEITEAAKEFLSSTEMSNYDFIKGATDGITIYCK